MSTTRDQIIANLEAQIEADKKKLEFLKDTQDFYDFDLGAGNKTVLTIDFNTSEGLNFIQSNNTTKLEEFWYSNYAGFLTTEETEARAVSTRLSNWLKMYRIHKFITTPDFVGTPSTFVIRYVSDDQDAAYDTFIALEVTSNESLVSGEFVFRSEDEANTALAFMKDSETEDDADLRSLFNV